MSIIGLAAHYGVLQIEIPFSLSGSQDTDDGSTPPPSETSSGDSSSSTPSNEKIPTSLTVFVQPGVIDMGGWMEGTVRARED